MNYTSAINNYYNLKNKYQEKRALEKDKINEKYDSLSWKERRAKFQRLHFKCINCDRNVGTIFQTVFLDEDKHIIAKCGDRKEPCDLDVDINLGYTKTFKEGIHEDTYEETRIHEIKKDIIVDKNNLLFGYINQATAIHNFDELKDELSTCTFVLERNNNLLTNITNNLEKNMAIVDLQQKYYLGINNINTLIKKSQEENNTQFIKESVQFYINELMPILKQYNDLIYSFRDVEYDEKTQKYMLIKLPYTIEDIEENIGNFNPSNMDDRIISFISSSFPKVHRKKERTKATTTKKLKIVEELPELAAIPIANATATANANATIDEPILIKRKKGTVKKVLQNQPSAFEQIGLETEFIPTMIENGDRNEMTEIFPEADITSEPIKLVEEEE
jgi:hypothetical protein